MSTLDVSLTRDVHAAAPQDAESVSNSAYSYERVQITRSLEPRDVANEIFEAGDEVLTAYNDGDPLLLGKVVAAVIDACVEWKTHHVLDLPHKHLPGAEEAARVALLKALAERVAS